MQGQKNKAKGNNMKKQDDIKTKPGVNNIKSKANPALYSDYIQYAELIVKVKRLHNYLSMHAYSCLVLVFQPFLKNH